MMRYGHKRPFALAASRSACLGTLIPPSVLMIVWGVLTELDRQLFRRRAAGRC
jgi:TRAP-type C4-dicarboxylate transport system permease large subunit